MSVKNLRNALNELSQHKKKILLGAALIVVPGSGIVYGIYLIKSFLKRKGTVNE